MGLLSTTFASLDVIVLGQLSSSEAVGYYAAAKRLTTPWTLISASVSASVYPLLHRLHEDRDRRKFMYAYAVAYRYLLAGLLPATVLVSLYASDAIRICYGPTYAPAGRDLAILCWNIVLSSKIINDYALIAIDDTRLPLILVAVMVSSCCGLALICIPWFGHIGAAVAVVGSGSVYYIAEAMTRRGRPFVIGFLSAAWRPAAAASVMAAIIVWCLHGKWNASVVVAVVAYVIVLVGLGGVPMEDIRRFWRSQ
jgi:O-antigen/teichoic acid export membrane protein